MPREDYGDEGYQSLIDRVRAAARDNGVIVEPDERDSPPQTLEEVVADLTNIEYVATDEETGKSEHGESMEAAWANLRGVSKRKIHNKIARWHDEQ